MVATAKLRRNAIVSTMKLLLLEHTKRGLAVTLLLTLLFEKLRCGDFEITQAQAVAKPDRRGGAFLDALSSLCRESGLIQS
jgi:hypothetical protein